MTSSEDGEGDGTGSFQGISGLGLVDGLSGGLVLEEGRFLLTVFLFGDGEGSGWKTGTNNTPDSDSGEELVPPVSSFGDGEGSGSKIGANNTPDSDSGGGEGDIGGVFGGGDGEDVLSSSSEDGELLSARFLGVGAIAGASIVTVSDDVFSFCSSSLLHPCL